MPSLEESPLQVLNIDPEADGLVQVPDYQRIERAGMLPARSRGFCEAVVRVCGTLTLHARYAP